MRIILLLILLLLNYWTYSQSSGFSNVKIDIQLKVLGPSLDSLRAMAGTSVQTYFDKNSELVLPQNGNTLLQFDDYKKGLSYSVEKNSKQVAVQNLKVNEDSLVKIHILDLKKELLGYPCKSILVEARYKKTNILIEQLIYYTEEIQLKREDYDDIQFAFRRDIYKATNGGMWLETTLENPLFKMTLSTTEFKFDDKVNPSKMFDQLLKKHDIVFDRENAAPNQ